MEYCFLYKYNIVVLNHWFICIKFSYPIISPAKGIPAEESSSLFLIGYGSFGTFLYWLYNLKSRLTGNSRAGIQVLWPCLFPEHHRCSIIVERMRHKRTPVQLRPFIRKYELHGPEQTNHHFFTNYH